MRPRLGWLHGAPRQKALARASWTTVRSRWAASAASTCKIHWSAALIAVLVGASLGRRARHRRRDRRHASASSPRSSLHEFGHALAARRFGVPTESIQLWALGGVAQLDREPPTPKAEGWIAAAGPLTSIVLAVGGIGAWFALGGTDADSAYVSVLAWLGVINACSRCSTCCPVRRSTAAASSRRSAGQIHGNKYRAMREAGRAGSFLGWVAGRVRPGADPPRAVGHLVGGHRPVHRDERQGRGRGVVRRRAPRRREGTRPHLVRRRRGRYRHGRRLDALGPPPARPGGRRGDHRRRRPARTASCSRTRCGPCPPSSDRG